MTATQFNNLKHFFAVNSADVARATGISNAHLSLFSDETRQLSHDLSRKIADYFAALAVERQTDNYFVSAWWFDDVTIIVEQFDDVDYPTLSQYRVRIFQKSSWLWQNKRKAKLIFYTEEKPTWEMISPYLVSFDLDLDNTIL